MLSRKAKAPRCRAASAASRFAARSFGGLRLDGLGENGLGRLGLSLCQRREGFLDAGGILLLCQGLDCFGKRLDLVLVFLLPEPLTLELLTQYLNGGAAVSALTIAGCVSR